jgi:hypothetical protein
MKQLRKIYPLNCSVSPVVEPADAIQGWRITFDDDSSVCGVPFASERDAERMIAELAKLGVVDVDTYENLPDESWNHCIAAALPW